MTTFPATSFLSNAGRQKGEMKTGFEDLLAATKQIPGAGVAESTLTIASGAVTPTLGVHAVDTEAAAAADDLTTITATNLPDGSFLWIRSVNSGRVVTLKHNAGGAGQLALLAGVDLVLDDPGRLVLLKRTGADWVEVGHLGKTVDRIPVLAKTGAYTLAAGDNGKLIDATSGTWTLSLLAAASAGDGFWFGVKAGSGTITIDPNSTETIDGATTLVLAPGDSATVVCTGAAWKTITQSRATALTDIACRVTKSADQSLTNNTLTAVTWDQESYDTAALHNTSSNTSRFTVPSGQDGKYQIMGVILFDTNGTGERLLQFYKNGAATGMEVVQPLTSGADYQSLFWAFEIALVAGDYLEIMAYQSSGGALNLIGPGGRRCVASFRRVG